MRAAWSPKTRKPHLASFADLMFGDFFDRNEKPPDPPERASCLRCSLGSLLGKSHFLRSVLLPCSEYALDVCSVIRSVLTRARGVIKLAAPSLHSGWTLQDARLGALAEVCPSNRSSPNAADF